MTTQQATSSFVDSIFAHQETALSLAVRELHLLMRDGPFAQGAATQRRVMVATTLQLARNVGKSYGHTAVVPRRRLLERAIENLLDTSIVLVTLRDATLVTRAFFGRLRDLARRIEALLRTELANLGPPLPHDGEGRPGPIRAEWRDAAVPVDELAIASTGIAESETAALRSMAALAEGPVAPAIARMRGRKKNGHRRRRAEGGTKIE